MSGVAVVLRFLLVHHDSCRLMKRGNALDLFNHDFVEKDSMPFFTMASQMDLHKAAQSIIR